MRPVAVFWACLTAAAFAFLIGVVMGAYSANNRITQVNDKHAPLSDGSKFGNGPTMARAPAASRAPVRYIF